MPRGAFRCIALALVLGAGGAPHAGAGASARDPSSIACPAPPAGWYLPAGTGKQVASPATDVRLRPSDVVTVNCHFFTRGGEAILVNVQLALPSDPNPNTDFFYGCGNSGGAGWDGASRTYRAASGAAWAYASFFDPARELGPREVGLFERATDQLLRNAAPYAHPCSLRVAPTAVRSTYTFDFATAAGSTKGSFVARAATRASVPMTIVSVHAPTVSLRVPTPAGARRLDVAIERGLTYRPGTATSSGVARFAVRVVRSTVPTCRTGVRGDLSVSTAPAVSLAVCGQEYLHGRAVTDIALRN